MTVLTRRVTTSLAALALCTAGAPAFVATPASAATPPSVTLSAPASAAPAARVLLSGRVSNAGATRNKTVVLQQVVGARWVTVGVRTGLGSTTYSFARTHAQAGTFRYRSQARLGTRVLATSPTRTLRIVRPAPPVPPPPPAPPTMPPPDLPPLPAPPTTPPALRESGSLPGPSLRGAAADPGQLTPGPVQCGNGRVSVTAPGVVQPTTGVAWWVPQLYYWDATRAAWTLYANGGYQYSTGVEKTGSVKGWVDYATRRPAGVYGWPAQSGVYWAVLNWVHSNNAWQSAVSNVQSPVGGPPPSYCLL